MFKKSVRVLGVEVSNSSIHTMVLTMFLTFFMHLVIVLLYSSSNVELTFMTHVIVFFYLSKIFWYVYWCS